MSIYRTMWNELKNRVDVSITQNIPRTDLLTVINAFEDHFKQEIMEEVMRENELQAKVNKKKQKK